jgi:polyferredoxin
VFQIASIGYLGLVNGEMLSQAMLAGWARHGIPWQNTLGLVVMTAAAFLLPLATGANIYCHQLCPHGAAQQLLKRGVKNRWKMPARLSRALILLRPALLLWVFLVAVCGWPFSLVDIEPFDAYLWRSAGWATIAVAVVGLTASAFVPMAYCRYGCPTGGVIEYLRTHQMSGWVRWSDGLALACLLLGALLLWGG